MDILPVELELHIISYLDYCSLRDYALTSKSRNKLVVAYCSNIAYQQQLVALNAYVILMHMVHLDLIIYTLTHMGTGIVLSVALFASTRHSNHLSVGPCRAYHIEKMVRQ